MNKNKADLLGKLVRDRVTDMVGVATTYTISMYGREFYLVEPKFGTGEPAFFEPDRLALEGQTRIKEERLRDYAY